MSYRLLARVEKKPFFPACDTFSFLAHSSLCCLPIKSPLLPISSLDVLLPTSFLLLCYLMYVIYVILCMLCVLYYVMYVILCNVMSVVYVMHVVYVMYVMLCMLCGLCYVCYVMLCYDVML